VFQAIVQQQRIEVPETSWLGHMSMAGFGLAIFIVSVLCINGSKKTQKQMGPWGPFFTVVMNKTVTEPTKRIAMKWGGGDEGFDWRSLMTFLIGMLGMTAILSSTGGFVLTLADFFQGLLMKMSGWPVLADLGAGGLCFILVILAMRNRGDDKADLGYGAACGFIFPLGGGTWSEITLQVGHWIPQIMHIG
jgi:hypothetical protein